jgi:hypothetical protein
VEFHWSHVEKQFFLKIFAGVLVYVLDSRLPDRVTGAVIVLIILKGGYMIITDVNSEREKERSLH